MTPGPARPHLIPMLLAILAVSWPEGRLYAAAAPPESDPVPMVADEFRFVPGSWGLYRLAPANTNVEHQLYFAVLEEKAQRKGKAFWVEIEVVTSNEPSAVTRVLLPETPQGPGDALEAIVQVSGFRPFKVPSRYLKPQAKKSGEAPAQFVKFDKATATPPAALSWKGRDLMASTVDAEDAKGNKVSVVVSEEAAPLCIVSLDSPEVAMELLDWGRDAKTKITGKPVGFLRWLFSLLSSESSKAPPKP